MSVSLQLIQQSENSEYWNLNYVSNQAIAGFQFNTPSGTYLHSSGGGAALAFSYVSLSGTFGVGMDQGGNVTVPAGNGLFLVLHNENVTQMSITNIILSDVNANSIQTQTPVQGIAYTVEDTTPPTVSSFTMSDTALKSGETSTVTLVFSEAVAGFSSDDDVTAPNGTLATMTSSDNITWTGTYTPTDNVENTTNVLTLATTYTDTAGNVGPSNTTLNYAVDTLPPVITLEGAENVTVELGVTYTDDGATADGSETVLATGTVDTSVVNTYTITYNATDANGNAAVPVTRTVTVVPAQPEVQYGPITDLVIGELHLFDTTTNDDVLNNLVQPPLDLATTASEDEYFSTTSSKPLYVYKNDGSNTINNSQFITGNVDLWNDTVGYNPSSNPEKQFSYLDTSTKQIGYKYVIQIENRSNMDIKIDEDFDMHLCYNYVNSIGQSASSDSIVCPFKAIDETVGYTHSGNESYLNSSNKVIKKCKSLYIGWTDLLNQAIKDDSGNLFVNVNEKVALNGNSYSNDSLTDKLTNSVLYSHIISPYLNQDGQEVTTPVYRYLTSSRISLYHGPTFFDVLGDNTTYVAWSASNPATISYNYSLLYAPNGPAMNLTTPNGFFNIPNSTANQPASLVNYGGQSTNWSATNSYWAFINESQFAACGDPHIKALDGLNYDFRYEGFMRYFECDDLIINVECAKGEEKWENLEYFRKMYLNQNGKELILDLGFRGEPVSVIKNDGFDIIEKNLEILSNANRFCGTCRGWKSCDDTKCTRHMKKYGHNIAELIRNNISLSLKSKNNDKFIISAENVNKHNLQPCNLTMGIKSNSKNIAGLAVSAEWVPFSILKSFNDINSIVDIKTRTI